MHRRQILLNPVCLGCRPGSLPWSPGDALVCAGISRCRPGYPPFMPDHPGLLRSSPGGIMGCPGVTRFFFFFFFLNLSRFATVVLNIFNRIGKALRFAPEGSTV